MFFPSEAVAAGIPRIPDLNTGDQHGISTAQGAITVQLGAEVIKVEQPGDGDQVRRLICGDDLRARGQSPSYLTCNVNKRGIVLDPKAAEAKEIVTRLIRDRDVVMENFKAGQMDRLGFGYDLAKSIKPDIIYCSISGYGQTGP